MKNKSLTAIDFPGAPCIFIGYGTDTHGYRVVIPGDRGSSMRIDVDKDAVINSSILATKAFVAKCRSDPLCDHMLPWVDVMFRPMDMLSLRSDLGSSIESFPGIPSDGGPVFEGFSQEHLDMLGRPVLKSFLPDGADKNRDFVGKVVSIDHDENSGGVMFEILYEDGDREDIPIDELRDLFQAYADKIFRKSQTVGANPQVQSRSGLVEHAVPVNSKCYVRQQRLEKLCQTLGVMVKSLFSFKIIPRLLGPKVIGNMNITSLFRVLMHSMPFVKIKRLTMVSVHFGAG